GLRALDPAEQRPRCRRDPRQPHPWTRLRSRLPGRAASGIHLSGVAGGSGREGRGVGRRTFAAAALSTLYVVATPIGNLEDVTLRSLRILGEVSAIAAEDTRVTARLLARHGLRKPMISYRAPVERRRRLLGSLTEERRTAVAFESPYRIGKSLAAIAEVMPERRLAIARELTKLHEELLRGTAGEVAVRLGDRPRGEITLVISGA